MKKSSHIFVLSQVLAILAISCGRTDCPLFIKRGFCQIKRVMAHFKVNVTALLHMNTGIDLKMIMRISEYPIVDSEMDITVFSVA